MHTRIHTCIHTLRNMPGCYKRYKIREQENEEMVQGTQRPERCHTGGRKGEHSVTCSLLLTKTWILF